MPNSIHQTARSGKASTAASDEPVRLTFDEAVKLLPEGDNIHTFRNPGAGLMIGADWDRASILDAMRKSPEIQVTGPTAQSMGHGLVIDAGDRMLFIEASRYDEAKS